MNNLAIIDDSPELLHELRNYFNGSQHLKCILAVNSVENFLRYYRDFLDIKVLLLDIILFKKSGIDGIPLILKKAKGVKIVVFSILDDKEAFFQSLSFGASGYLIKNISPLELENKLVSLLEEGKFPICNQMISHLVQYFQPTFTIAKADLSVQEFNITRMLADGTSYQSIADLLAISINGIRFHVKKIYRKLNIKSRQELKMLISEGVKYEKSER